VRSPLGSALFYLFTRPITDYKAKALKQDELRKRREEQQVEIRRQKREENIAKRRNFVATAAVDSDEEASGNWESPVRLISYLNPRLLMYSSA
jgi:Importin beta binding domain